MFDPSGNALAQADLSKTWGIWPSLSLCYDPVQYDCAILSTAYSRVTLACETCIITSDRVRAFRPGQAGQRFYEQLNGLSTPRSRHVENAKAIRHSVLIALAREPSTVHCLKDGIARRWHELPVKHTRQPADRPFHFARFVPRCIRCKTDWGPFPERREEETQIEGGYYIRFIYLTEMGAACGGSCASSREGRRPRDPHGDAVASYSGSPRDTGLQIAATVPNTGPHTWAIWVRRMQHSTSPENRG